jgi:hypothetical protein
MLVQDRLFLLGRLWSAVVVLVDMLYTLTTTVLAVLAVAQPKQPLHLN